jgi:hypothetical protein
VTPGVAVLRHVMALVLGVLVAVASVVVHRTSFPLGLVLALVTTFAVAGWLLRSRHPRTAASYAAGWLATLLLVLLGRPEGDYALVSDLPGYALMLAGLPIFVVGLVGLTGGRRAGT